MSDNTETEKSEWDDRELGALWVNTKNGNNEKYLTGKIKGEKVIVFKNKYKEENAKAPDFKVYIQKPQSDSAVSTPIVQVEEEPDLI
tara:strand:+ start:61 stop:321 length:261 start_codon:yes stop_codon:yes gene_type:complete